MGAFVTVDVHYKDAFKESQHPRGQPENKGEFAKTSGGGKSAAELHTTHKALYAKYVAATGAERTALGEQLNASWRVVAAAKKAEKGVVVKKRAAPVMQTKPVAAPTSVTTLRPPGSKNPDTIKAFSEGHKAVAALQKAVPSMKYASVYTSKHSPDDVWMLISNQHNDRPPHNPLTVPGMPGVTGLGMRIDAKEGVLHISEVTSAEKGAGGKIVGALLKALPNYKMSISTDLSDGFWEHMYQKYPGRFKV